VLCCDGCGNMLRRLFDLFQHVEDSKSCSYQLQRAGCT
jgi:hypothetical protein